MVPLGVPLGVLWVVRWVVSMGGSMGGAWAPASVGRLNRRCHVIIMLMKQPDDEWTCATVELQLMQSA